MDSGLAYGWDSLVVSQTESLMPSQKSPSARSRLFASGIGLAAALSLLSVSPAFAGQDKDNGNGFKGFTHLSFVRFAHEDDQFFHHLTDRNRHCHDGHG